MGSEQGILPGCESVGGIDGADGSGARPAEESGAAKPRYEVINREQLCWRRVDVERLIGEEHAARAVWEFVGQLDLSGYREEVRAVEGKAGRPGWQPRLLISLWIYAYSAALARILVPSCITRCKVISPSLGFASNQGSTPRQYPLFTPHSFFSSPSSLHSGLVFLVLWLLLRIRSCF